MRRWVCVLWMFGLAIQDVGAAEGGGADEADRASGVGIEFYDDEVDLSADLPQDSQQAERLKMILALAPRVHNRIVDQAVSPDGERVVYVVERDAGATTAPSLQAFLGRPASLEEQAHFGEKMLGERIFAGEKMTTQARVEWKDGRHVVVHSDDGATFLRAEHDGISIEHQFTP